MSKPIFEPPAGYHFRADGVQMSLDWRANFGTEKTAALQKAQFATAQKAAALIDPYVPLRYRHIEKQSESSQQV